MSGPPSSTRGAAGGTPIPRCRAGLRGCGGTDLGCVGGDQARGGAREGGSETDGSGARTGDVRGAWRMAISRMRNSIAGISGSASAPCPAWQRMHCSWSCGCGAGVSSRRSCCAPSAACTDASAAAHPAAPTSAACNAGTHTPAIRQRSAYSDTSARAVRFTGDPVGVWQMITTNQYRMRSAGPQG